MKRIDESHVFTGIQRDLSVSKHPVQFLYDGRNIRLTAREGDSLLSITNERSTVEAVNGNEVQVVIQGTYLGHCLLNQYLVVFSTTTTYDSNRQQTTYRLDYISRIDLSTLEEPVLLFDGKDANDLTLKFHPLYPIEAIPSYETESIQKVYWTDGLNQPRVVNIIGKGNPESFTHYNSKSFDFVRELKLQETITVEKLLGASGEFAPGVIQYAFTYFDKYMQETAVFYTTPLYYISYADRGASPEDKVENAFKITVDNVDHSFDYLRIYSIQRTSINGTPICKRIQDIETKNLDYVLINPSGQDVETNRKYKASYTDTGFSGNTIDPTELLYKGGEVFNSNTICQKDNTLFLGGIHQTRENINSIKSSLTASGVLTIVSSTRNFIPNLVSREKYVYSNQLTSFDETNTKKCVPCAGFKYGETYRLGFQFQYKNGQWSEPIFKDDFTIADIGTYASQDFVNNHPDFTPPSTNPLNLGNIVTVPIFQGTLNSTGVNAAYNAGYRKVRAVAVFPEVQDRTILCQGVINPTLYTDNHRYIYQSDTHSQYVGDLQAQSDWFFRAGNGGLVANDKSVSPVSPIGVGGAGGGALAYTSRGTGITGTGTTAYDPRGLTSGMPNIRTVEIQGDYSDDNKFRVRRDFVTMHSPDLEFDDRLALSNFSNSKCYRVGKASFGITLSDIDIQTETPTISNSGSGFIHRSFVKSGTYGIISGLFYDDFLVEDWAEKNDIKNNITVLDTENSSVKWMVYLWNKSGSLNNDINRPADRGTVTSALKKKKISNLRYSTTSYNYYDSNPDFLHDWQKPQLFSSEDNTILKIYNEVYRGNIDTLVIPDNSDGMYFAFNSTDIGDPNIKTEFTENSNWWKTFCVERDTNYPAGLYKYSNPWYRPNTNNDYNMGNQYIDLALKKDSVRIKYKTTPHLVFGLNSTTIWTNFTDTSLPIVEITQIPTARFGGSSEDALKENIWIPCGEPVSLVSGSPAVFFWEWGDTYYQRYDCLKTYAFTPEDVNQVVEIGSFMLETHVNIDGRYDRNRGQSNNLNMSPVNFNLINPVYSQLNNFFTYKILPEDYYTNTDFPNQITWTKEKQSGADVDMWTNVTLASTYDMDGSKGKVEELTTWKDNIFCFQNKGISNILFNSRVQIPVSDGVPIEISNSYKVDGYKYISDGIGCDDKQLIMSTPQGVYFIDSVGSHLFHIGDGFTDISAKNNMTSIFKKEKGNWKKLLYDDINHDLYLVKGDESLCYSEPLGQFTSWMDYADLKLIETYDGHVFTMKGIGTTYGLWRMFEGEGYNNFFDANYPWGFTFVSNGTNEGIVGLDKTFTNVEFRASVEGDGELSQSTDKFTPTLPFNSIETWNEYQHGYTTLENMVGHSAMVHGGITSALKRKFRIWRCDIPRDNKDVNATTENPMGIYRKDKHPLDRMRNPWLYLKVKKNAAGSGAYLAKTEVHDIMVSYFV